MPKHIPKVHISFKAHAKGDRFSNNPTPRKVKTVLFEEGLGFQFGVHALPEESSYRFLKTRKEQLVRDSTLGKWVSVGEGYISESERRDLETKMKAADQSDKRSRRNPTLANIRHFFSSNSDLHQFRHFLIRRSIKTLLHLKKGPIRSEYGTAHSILTRELQKEGILSRRALRNQVFSPSEALGRKLAFFKNPVVSDLEYKRAFLSWMLDCVEYLSKHIFQKESSELRETNVRVSRVIENALLQSLSEEQLTELIRSGPKTPQLLFSFNGLPERHTRSELINWVVKKYPRYARFLRPKMKDKK